MKTKAFTLVELMVVIAIVAILASAVLPVSNVVMRKVRALQARHSAIELRKAIGTYSTEYRRFPVRETGPGGGDLETNSGSKLMNVLLGSDKEAEPGGLNTRRRSFFSGRKASDGDKPRNGIAYESGGGGVLYDPWGNLYKLIIDTSRDERCTDPSQPGETVAQDSLVWSLGPDGKDDRGEGDDIVIW